MSTAKDLNLEATELRLGLPGTDINIESQNHYSININVKNNSKRPISESPQQVQPSSKTQVVGWPPVRSYRKNSFQAKKTESEGAFYVKVSMDGAPYLRKIDLKFYKDYTELLKALEHMFKFKAGEYCEREGYNGSEYVPTYEDKDGDWMLVGDVPWEMFTTCCKRLRIMKRSEAKGLGCA